MCQFKIFRVLFYSTHVFIKVTFYLMSFTISLRFYDNLALKDVFDLVQNKWKYKGGGLWSRHLPFKVYGLFIGKWVSNYIYE